MPQHPADEHLRRRLAVPCGHCSSPSTSHGPDDEAQHFVETIVSAAREVGMLSDDLVQLSRLGRAELHLATCPAWANLLGNAFKYTRLRDDTHIEVRAAREGGEIVFFVRDNGVGFDMAYADKLFAVFQRLHDSHEFEGTGIGLAIVRRIVERHGGKAWAEAVLDGGATCCFSLPTPTGGTL